MSSRYQQPTDSDRLARAIRLVTASQFGSVSTLARALAVGHREATELMDVMQERGIVGPADGSRARSVYVRRCEQCGRLGTRGYRTLPATEHTPEIWLCVAAGACRRRWPAHTR